MHELIEDLYVEDKGRMSTTCKHFGFSRVLKYFKKFANVGTVYNEILKSKRYKAKEFKKSYCAKGK